MKVLRTPDERFQDLDAFPYHPSYVEINDITLVAQDWGGPITLWIVAADPDRFARVVIEFIKANP